VRSEVEEFNKTWIQLMKCNHCDFGFTKEIPVRDNFFEARYDIEFDAAFESTNNFKEDVLAQCFKLLKKYGRTSGDLLDIGSFAGILMRYAKDKGFNSYGVEVNPTMAKYSKDQLQLDVFNGPFLEFPCDDNRYDVITLIDVLEHLLQPREMLEKCHRVLKPGGQILIKVPNCDSQIFKQNIANWLGVSNLGVFASFGHINHFSPASLSKVLTELGFEVQECIVAESETWQPTTLKAKLKNQFRKCVFLGMELLRKVTGINIGLNITIIAKKNR
jgi:2-polyprenyl-3-methyl-5-hydroxy-6-metoxy-1,4-benzoquinol methylase